MSGKCGLCQKTMRQPSRGRKKLYCSNRCRQRAFYNRFKEKNGVPYQRARADTP